MTTSASFSSLFPLFNNACNVKRRSRKKQPCACCIMYFFFCKTSNCFHLYQPKKKKKILLSCVRGRQKLNVGLIKCVCILVFFFPVIFRPFFFFISSSFPFFFFFFLLSFFISNGMTNYMPYSYNGEYANEGVIKNENSSQPASPPLQQG